ncbi:CHAT domain protein [Ceratobasidium sp. AG-Ba]|nr:CHAT domain protein [Ceratobasidium sp. AG-Ba]QRW11786.1 CHAT domain protein [Ceratobasidium sp. AG-Ba]
MLEASLFSELAESLRLRFLQRGSPSDIVDAIRSQDMALKIVVRGNSRWETRCEHLASLAILWQCKFEHLGDLDAADKAAEYYARAIQPLPRGEPAIPELLHNLGLLWGRRFDQLGELVDLNKAIEYQTQTVLLTPRGHTDMSKHLWNLVSSYQRRFERIHDLADVDKAIEYCTEAVQVAPDSHPLKLQCLEGLGALWICRYERLGSIEDLKRAIDCRERLAHVLTSDSHTHKPKYLNALGNSQRRRYEQLRDLTDLDNAIQSYSQAIQLASIGHPDRSEYMHHLGRSWFDRFERLGHLSDINQAVQWHTEAVNLTPKSHSDKLERLNELGASLTRRFVRQGDLADADKAIQYLTQAVQLAPKGHSRESTILNNLGTSFLHRFERLGDLEDLRKATDYYIKAVQLTPKDHADKSMHISNLGNVWYTRFQLQCDVDCLEKATELHELAVRFTPQDHHEMPMRLSNLGNSLLSRFQQTGDEKDLESAIDCYEKAVELTPSGNPIQQGNTNNLGNAWQLRFERLNNPDDIDKAIEYRTKAVQLTPEGHTDKPMYLMNLGFSQLRRFEQLGFPSDLEYASATFKNGAESPMGNTSYRLQCARQWAQCSIKIGISPLPAYQKSFALLPQLIWLGLTIRGRYDVMDKVNDLAAEAAAWAISIQSYDMALEWLEEGRSIVWSQILQLRTPFDELALVDSTLANSLKEVSSQLDGAGSTVLAANLSAKSSLKLERKAQHIHNMANQWEELVEKARRLPGFHDFMRPRTSRQLKQAAVRGPVVIISTHKTRSDALVILPHHDNVIHIPLTQFLLEQFQCAHKLVFSRFGHRAAGNSARGIKRDKPKQPLRELPELLIFIWSCIVGPVLSRLGYTQKLADNDLPHITWCAAGALSFLPLHAAGLYDGSSHNAFDLVVSSYTPTLGALIPKRTPLTTQQAGILAIGQAHTYGFPPLPKTVEELDMIGKHAKVTRLQRLDGTSATVNATLAAMEKHSWVHLACHASQNKANPIHSAFHLHDGELTLEQIVRRAFKNKGLAFLSACQTASGDIKVPDEATHLAAGMLVAGYPSVIATMWSIMDDDAPEIVDEVYADLIRGDEMDHTRAAVALHKASSGANVEQVMDLASVAFLYCTVVVILNTINKFKKLLFAYIHKWFSRRSRTPENVL